MVIPTVYPVVMRSIALGELGGSLRDFQGTAGYRPVVYQACVVPQCGQVTLVETAAMKK
jgi:hypothetical protein